MSLTSKVYEHNREPINKDAQNAVKPALGLDIPTLHSGNVYPKGDPGPKVRENFKYTGDFSNVDLGRLTFVGVLDDPSRKADEAGLVMRCTCGRYCIRTLRGLRRHIRENMCPYCDYFAELKRGNVSKCKRCGQPISSRELICKLCGRDKEKRAHKKIFGTVNQSPPLVSSKYKLKQRGDGK